MERLYPRFVVIHHTAGFDVPALTINRYHAERGFGIILRSPQSLVAEYIRRGFKPVSYTHLILTLYVGKECDYMERLYPRFVVVHHTAGFDVSALTINLSLIHISTEVCRS